MIKAFKVRTRGAEEGSFNFSKKALSAGFPCEVCGTRSLWDILIRGFPATLSRARGGRGDEDARSREEPVGSSEASSPSTKSPPPPGVPVVSEVGNNGFSPLPTPSLSNRKSNPREVVDARLKELDDDDDVDSKVDIKRRMKEEEEEGGGGREEVVSFSSFFHRFAISAQNLSWPAAFFRAVCGAGGGSGWFHRFARRL